MNIKKIPGSESKLIPKSKWLFAVLRPTFPKILWESVFNFWVILLKRQAQSRNDNESFKNFWIWIQTQIAPKI